MDSFFPIILIGISLSMDAFSLALVYGIIGIPDKDKIILSIMTGMYHFFMPLIGLQIGKIITRIPFINLNLLSSIILLIIGLDLIFSKYNQAEPLKKNLLGYFLFGFYVSVDSLSIGIGLKTITNKYTFSFITFLILSTLFTYIGASLGNKIKKITGSYARKIGGMILLIISIYLLKKFTRNNFLGIIKM